MLLATSTSNQINTYNLLFLAHNTVFKLLSLGNKTENNVKNSSYVKTSRPHFTTCDSCTRDLKTRVNADMTIIKLFNTMF